MHDAATLIGIIFYGTGKDEGVYSRSIRLDSATHADAMHGCSDGGAVVNLGKGTPDSAKAQFVIRGQLS